MGHLSTATSTPASHLTSGPCRIVPRASHELMVKVMAEVVADAAPRRYCRRVTALPIEAAPLPPVPNSIAGIRALLPNGRRTEFDSELLAAVDSEDLDVIRAFRRRWWILAAFETDPSLRNIPEEPMFPSPLAR